MKILLYFFTIWKSPRILPRIEIASIDPNAQNDHQHSNTREKYHQVQYAGVGRRANISRCLGWPGSPGWSGSIWSIRVGRHRLHPHSNAITGHYKDRREITRNDPQVFRFVCSRARQKRRKSRGNQDEQPECVVVSFGNHFLSPPGMRR